MQISFFDQFMAVLMLLLVGYWTYQSVKSNPQQLSASNLNQASKKMGILALFLIGFIAMLYFMLPPGEPVMNLSKELQQISTKPTNHDRSV